MHHDANERAALFPPRSGQRGARGGREPGAEVSTGRHRRPVQGHRYVPRARPLAAVRLTDSSPLRLLAQGAPAHVPQLQAGESAVSRRARGALLLLGQKGGGVPRRRASFSGLVFRVFTQRVTTIEASIGRGAHFSPLPAYNYATAARKRHGSLTGPPERVPSPVRLMQRPLITGPAACSSPSSGATTNIVRASSN